MDAKEAHAKVQRDCRPFLAALSTPESGLYRGVSLGAPTAFEGLVLRDRKPKNMPVELHQAADAWFSERFGVRYRGAALFCIGDSAQAALHGGVYRIYPVGGFQFCWSPLVTDLHVWCDQNGYLEKAPDDLTSALTDLDYREDGLVDALGSGCEIMVSCRSYVAVASVGATGQRDAVVNTQRRSAVVIKSHGGEHE